MLLSEKTRDVKTEEDFAQYLDDFSFFEDMWTFFENKWHFTEEEEEND